MHRIMQLNLSIQDSFMISEGIDGSSLYFIVTYFDANQNNSVCGTSNISSSSCLQDICMSSLPISCYQNGGAINISIFATNSLGNGWTSCASIGK